MPEEIKEETTNKVLETKIDGLSKLTDERFLSIKETLVRIEASTKHFVLRDELVELKTNTEKTAKELKDTTEKIASNVKDVIETKNNDFENRVRGLETFMNTLVGKMAMIGIGSSVIVSLLFIGIQYFLNK